MVDTFHWIVPRKLAGAGRPGLLRDLDQDLAWLRHVGIRHLVSLTREPPEIGEEDGISVFHFPIPDMGIPTPRQAYELCNHVLDVLEKEEPVVLHCKAGLGRTGTMLACCLVSLGDAPEEAIIRVRKVCHYYIQNPAQEMFVRHYGELLETLAQEGKLLAPFKPPPVS